MDEEEQTPTTQHSSASSQWRNINPLQFCFIKATLSLLEESFRYPLVLIKTHQQVLPHRTPENCNQANNNSNQQKPSFRKTVSEWSISSRRSLLKSVPSPIATSFSHSCVAQFPPSTNQTARYTLHLYRTHGIRGLFRGYPWYVGP